MITYVERLWINRVRLPILHAVSQYNIGEKPTVILYTYIYWLPCRDTKTEEYAKDFVLSYYVMHHCTEFEIGFIYW